MSTSLKTAADFRKHLELNLRIHSTKKRVKASNAFVEK